MARSTEKLEKSVARSLLIESFMRCSIRTTHLVMTLDKNDIDSFFGLSGKIWFASRALSPPLLTIELITLKHH